MSPGRAPMRARSVGRQARDGVPMSSTRASATRKRDGGGRTTRRRRRCRVGHRGLGHGSAAASGGTAAGLPDEAVEHRRERCGCEAAAESRATMATAVRHWRPASVTPDRAEVGVLDRPAVALDRGDRHAERRGVALPRHDERADAARRAREFLDRARRRARSRLNCGRSQKLKVKS